jgi:hypothetical protein
MGIVSYIAAAYIIVSLIILFFIVIKPNDPTIIKINKSTESIFVPVLVFGVFVSSIIYSANE